MHWKTWKTWQWLALALALFAFAALKVFFILGSENPKIHSKIRTKCEDLSQICNISGAKVHADRKIEHSKPFLLIVEAHFAPEQVSFTMEGMDMGQIAYRFSPVENQQNQWQTQAILPICATGRRDWVLQIQSAQTAPLEIEFAVH